MGMRQRRQALLARGLTTVPDSRTSHGARIARTLRHQWWPRAALAGAVLAVVGLTILSDGPQAAAVLTGIAIFGFAVLGGPGVNHRHPVDGQLGRAQMVLASSSCVGSRREPPVPQGGGPGFAAG